MTRAGSNMMNIPYKLLFAIGLIAPVLVFVVVIDILFLGGAIKPFVSLSLFDLFLYILIFETSHIVASFLSFADREYISFYKKKLFIRLPILIAGVSLIMIYADRNITETFMAGFLVYHIVAQQTGITKMMIGTKHILHDTWKMLAFTNKSLLWVYIFSFQPLATILGGYTKTLVYFGLLLFCFVSYLIFRDIDNSTAKKYFLISTSIFLSSIFLSFVGYFFLAVFVLRATHDITAFVFYTVHDRNRNIESTKNVLYKFLKPLKIPIIVLVPVVSVLIAHVIRLGDVNITSMVSILGLVAVTHYYIESFMWKYSSIHRHQIKLSL